MIEKKYTSIIVGSDGKEHRVMTYEDAAKLVSDLLVKVPNVKQFAKENGLHYNTLIAIKNGRGKAYSGIINEVIEIFYKMKLKGTTVYFLD